MTPNVRSYDFVFVGAIDRFGVGKTRKIWYTVLFLPPKLERKLPFGIHPRLRVDGEIAEVPVTGAGMPTGDGRRYFIVSPMVLKDAEVGLGVQVEMRFRIADQNAVDMHPALTRALLENKRAFTAWEKLTPGKRRGFTHRVHGARTPATIERRVEEVIAALVGVAPEHR